jgi:hypothetical protein
VDVWNARHRFHTDQPLAALSALGVSNGMLKEARRGWWRGLEMWWPVFIHRAVRYMVDLEGTAVNCFRRNLFLGMLAAGGKGGMSDLWEAERGRFWNGLVLEMQW